MAEKKGFWASLFGGSGCSCGMSIEEEKAEDKRPPKEKGGCCSSQIMEEPPCPCGEAESPQTESVRDGDAAEEKRRPACCDENT